MATISATNSATVSLQSVLNRSRLEQARRQADQAEAEARDLRSQADQAEQDAQQGQQKVRSISSEIAKSATTYSPKVQGSQPEVPEQTQDFLVRLYQATSQKFADSGNALKTDANAPPVVNSQGQATGRILNTTA
jgi:hypothetical protein